MSNVNWAHLPVPLEPLPRLGQAIGLRHLWAERDGLTGLAAGGSKARKAVLLRHTGGVAGLFAGVTWL